MPKKLPGDLASNNPKTFPEPDPFRLKYRIELHECVARLVRETRGTRVGDAERIAGNLVPCEDRESFVAMIIRELRLMHEGNIARYRLRLAEYREWKVSVPKL